MNETPEKKHSSQKTLYTVVSITAVSVISAAVVIAHINNIPATPASPDDNEISDDTLSVPAEKPQTTALPTDNNASSENININAENKHSSQSTATESDFNSKVKSKTAKRKSYNSANAPMSILDHNTTLYVFDHPDSDNNALETHELLVVSDFSSQTDNPAQSEESKEEPAADEIISSVAVPHEKAAFGESSATARAMNSGRNLRSWLEHEGAEITSSKPSSDNTVGIASIDVPISTVQPIHQNTSQDDDLASIAGTVSSPLVLEGTDGIYSGEPRQFLVLGNYNNLCVGQNIESIFNAQSGRSVKLLFDEGYVTIIDGTHKLDGISFSSLDTSHSVKSATATVSFTYGTQRYSVNFKYSVVPWSASIFYTDENTPDQTGMIPDENLKLDLSRYYSLYKRLNPQFSGWRTKDGTQLYTTECIMTTPDMKLYPCFALAEPEINGDTGRLTGTPDIDTTIFSTHAGCKKLIIGADIQYIDLSGLTTAFPDLEEIEVENGNTVYSSYNGALYKGNILICVPPKTAALEIKDGTTAIADNALYGVGIEKLVIPDTVTEISSNAFAGGTIHELTVPASIKAGNPSAFTNSDADIKNVIETGEFAVYEEINGEKVLVKVYENAPADFVVEAGTTKIANGAFADCIGIKTVTFTDNALTEIGAGAFKNCIRLGGIILPENVVSIGDSAFEGCDRLNQVKLSGNSLVSIGSRTFASCNSLSSFGSDTNSIDLRNLTSIGTEAFMSCPLITSAYLSNYMTETPDGLFKNCINLNTISDWGAANVISDDTFRNTGFISVELRTVSDIAAGAFADCEQLSSILIGADVVNIDADFVQDNANIMLAFAGKTTSYNGNSADALLAGNKIYKTVFTTIGNDETLAKHFDTQSSTGTYKTGQTGGLYSHNDVDNTYTLIKVGPNLTDFTMIKENVSAIMPNAFADCDNIQSIVFNRTVSEIPAGLLEGKQSLKSVTFRNVQGTTSNTNVTIGDYVFKDCTALKSISFNSGVTNVGVGVCENCTGLYNIEWGAKAEKIPENAFKGCTSLTSISITTASSASLLEVGDSAFEGCNMLVRVNGFNTNRFRSVTKIGNKAFKDCAKIEDIMLPFSIEAIGDNCFEGCENLMSVRVYCDNMTSPFTLGNCIFGSPQTLTDAQCFDIWTTDKEILEAYRNAWQAQLDGDYGEGIVKDIVISSKLIDDGGDVGIDGEVVDQESGDGIDNTEDKADISNTPQDPLEGSDTKPEQGSEGSADAETENGEKTPSETTPSLPDDISAPDDLPVLDVDDTTDLPDPDDESEKQEETNKPAEPEEPKKNDELDEADEPEKSEEATEADKADEPDDADEPEKPEESTESDKANESEKPEDSNNTDESDNSEGTSPAEYIPEISDAEYIIPEEPEVILTPVLTDTNQAEYTIDND